MSLNKGSGPGHTSKEQFAVFNRYFQGLDVVEAEASLIIIPTTSDIKSAEQGEPSHCALAQAARRLYESEAVLFFKTIAYLDLPVKGGKRKVVRFALDRTTAEAVVHFDKTGEFPAEGFTLLPPPESKRLDFQTSKARRYKAAALKGEKKRCKNTHTVSTIDNGIRSGAGQVHFTSKES